MQVHDDVRAKLQSLPEKMQRAVAPQFSLYEVACELSRMPDKRRAAHWKARAIVLERRLRERMGLPLDLGASE